MLTLMTLSILLTGSLDLLDAPGEPHFKFAFSLLPDPLAHMELLRGDDWLLKHVCLEGLQEALLFPVNILEKGSCLDTEFLDRDTRTAFAEVILHEAMPHCSDHQGVAPPAVWVRE